MPLVLRFIHPLYRIMSVNASQYFSGVFTPPFPGVERNWIFLERSGKGVHYQNNGAYTRLSSISNTKLSFSSEYQNLPQNWEMKK